MYKHFVIAKLNNNSFIDDFFYGLLGNDIKIVDDGEYKIVYHSNEDDLEIFEALEALIDELPELKALISGEYKNDNDMLNDINILKNMLEGNKYPVYMMKDLVFEHVLKGNGMPFKEMVMRYALFTDTIKSYIEMNMNTSRAADELFMHRNTLINKLDRFKLETGYDVREFKDAYVIYTFIGE